MNRVRKEVYIGQVAPNPEERQMIIAEIEELRKLVAEPKYGFEVEIYQGRIEGLFGILYANDDGQNDAECELAEYEMNEDMI